MDLLLDARRRSTLPATRNPLLQLPAAQRFSDLPTEARGMLRALLMDLSADARARAQYCWSRHKAPMAVYWKAVSVYARHIARFLR